MKKLLFALALVAGTLAAGAQSQGQMARRYDSTSIPSDILAKEYVLLVQIPYKQKSWIKDFDKVMREHYTGPYEIVPWQTDVAGAYPDSSKYRYVLDIAQTVSTYTTSNTWAQTGLNPAGTRELNQMHRHLYLYDRRTGKRADSKLDAQNVLKILAFYADRLSGKSVE